jgi:hypothetical protein
VRSVGLLTAAILAVASVAAGHPLAPSLLELSERDGGEVAVLWKTSLFQPRGAAPIPVLPPVCVVLGEVTAEQDGSARVLRWEVACGDAGLAGQSVGVAGLEVGDGTAIVRVTDARGERIQTLLSSREPTFEIPEHPVPTRVARDYLGLGVRHLLLGFDHVLFILALLLLIVDRRTLLLTITAFTLGHSVTLVLASLGYVSLPSAASEVAIAASLLLLAAEIPARQRGGGWRLARRPWRVAFLFGLLHGLGFAGVLSEVGLPVGEIPLALFAFNIGIELGQLALVAVATGMALCGLGLEGRPPLVRLLSAYAIGALAGYWVIERLAVAARAVWWVL